MSECKTSPGNEAGMTGFEVEATSGAAPTVVTRDGVWMSTSPVPTVSTVDTIRAGVGMTPTASTSDDAVGGTPVVIEDAGGNGSVAQGNTGTPTASTDKVIRLTNGMTPTASVNGTPTAASTGGTVIAVDRIYTCTGLTPPVIESTGIVGPAAQGINGNPTVSTEDAIRAGSGAAPTVIENTSNVGPVAEGISGSNADGPPVETHCAESTANVAFNDRETRATNGATTTVITRGDAVGGTAVLFHLNTIRGTNNVGPVAQGIGNNPTVHTPTEIHCTQGTTNVALLDRETRAVNGTSPTVITRGDDVRGTPTAHRLRLVRFAPRHSVAADNGMTPVVAGERLAA